MLIELQDDIQTQMGNTLSAQRMQKMVRQCLEWSCGMDKEKSLGRKWSKRGEHSIRITDWDLAPQLGEKVTETNGFLCLV